MQTKHSSRQIESLVTSLSIETSVRYQPGITAPITVEVGKKRGVKPLLNDFTLFPTLPQPIVKYFLMSNI